MKNLKTVRILFPIAFLISWEILSSNGYIDRVFIPPPSEIFVALQNDVLNGELLVNLLATIKRMFFGVSISTLLGVIGGLIIGLYKPLYKVLSIYIDFLRSIPATALVPLFIYVFGIGDTYKVAIIVYGTSLILLLNTIEGVISVKNERIIISKLLGLSDLKILWYVILPGALPSIIVGLRISISLALVLAVVAEMYIGAIDGLGFYINFEYEKRNVAEMYAGIIITGFLGFLLNLGLVKLQEKFVHWENKI